MAPPPLLADRPRPVQAALAIGGPVLLGVICGLLLGWNETAYLVLSILAIAGGVSAGYEHHGAREGALRGVLGGFLFGTAIIVTSEITGTEPEAELPDPEVLLVVLTTVLSALFGALGGWLRERRDRPGATRL